MNLELELAVLDSPVITEPLETAVACALARYADQKNLETFVSAATIARETRYSERSVRAATETLVTLGIIERRRRRHMPTVFSFKPDRLRGLSTANPAIDSVEGSTAASAVEADNGNLQQAQRQTSALTTANPATEEDLKNSLKTEHEDQRRTGGAKQPPVENYKVLVVIAHGVLDARDAGIVDADAVVEELKCRAARFRIPYEGDRWRRALDSAERQRRQSVLAATGT